MKIAIVGVGGVGGYVGGHLARTGTDVRFLARGAHLQALRTEGLSVLSNVARIDRLGIQATDDPEEIGRVDVAFLAVKLFDSEAAIARMRPMIGHETTVVSLQNGVDAVDQMIAAFGRERVLAASCHVSAAIKNPGVIHHTGTMAQITLGELDGRKTARLSALVDACKRAGLDGSESPDIRRTIWEKFIFLSAVSGATALARSSIGPIRDDGEGRLFIGRALAESTAVARANGMAFPEDHAEKALDVVSTLPPTMKTSMLHDLERGARLELPWLSGAVVRLGRESGVPVPTHEIIVAALRPHQNGRA